MRFIFLHCRPGFENECAAEIQALAAEFNIHGYCKAKANAAYVSFHPQGENQALQLMESLAFSRLIFTRQWFLVIDLLSALPVSDRISPLIAAIQNQLATVKDIFIEYLDTNEGKSLSGLCNKIARPFTLALEKTDIHRDTQSTQRLHICFFSSSAAAIGFSSINNSSPWPMGIPRLRFPKEAPSRSTLKLDEAILTFFPKNKVENYFRSGMNCVDLGAAPGGWSYQLVRRNMYVTAIDNGPMNEKLLDTGLVTHQREDAFRFQPHKTVDWMVCDIVDKPARVMDLMTRWLTNQWCRKTIFNLKLPMKKRYQEVSNLLQKLTNALEENNLKFNLLCKQLYHDREEVTVFVELL